MLSAVHIYQHLPVVAIYKPILNVRVRTVFEKKKSTQQHTHKQLVSRRAGEQLGKKVLFPFLYSLFIFVMGNTLRQGHQVAGPLRGVRAQSLL